MNGRRVRRWAARIGIGAVIVVLSVGALSHFLRTVDVSSDSSALDAAFERVIAEQSTTRLGDVVAGAGLFAEPWDRMYTVGGNPSDDALNALLGVDDVRWPDLARGPEEVVHIFVRDHEVVHACRGPARLYGGLDPDEFAIPDSEVGAYPRIVDAPSGGTDTMWLLDIEQFS